MKLSLLHKNVYTSSHIRDNLMALIAVVSLSSRYAQQIIVTQAGAMKLGLS